MNNFAQSPTDVRRARIELGLTQEEMAEELGVTRRALVYWETDGLPVNGTGRRHYWSTVDRIRQAKSKSAAVAIAVEPDFVIEHKGFRTLFHPKTPRAREAVRNGPFRSLAHEGCLRVDIGPEFNESSWRETQHWDIIWGNIEDEGLLCVLDQRLP